MIPEGQMGAGGDREHDILVITDKGNRNITGFPYGPEHLIVGAARGSARKGVAKNKASAKKTARKKR